MFLCPILLVMGVDAWAIGSSRLRLKNRFDRNLALLAPRKNGVNNVDSSLSEIYDLQKTQYNASIFPAHFK